MLCFLKVAPQIKLEHYKSCILSCCTQEEPGSARRCSWTWGDLQGTTLANMQARKNTEGPA